MQVSVVVVLWANIWSCHHLSLSSRDSRTCSGALCGFSTLPSSNICFYVMFFSIMSSRKRKLKPHRLYWFFVSKPLCLCTGEPLRLWSDTRSWWLFPPLLYFYGQTQSLILCLTPSSEFHFLTVIVGTLCHWYLSFGMLCDSLFYFLRFCLYFSNTWLPMCAE